jgi:integrase
LRRGELLGLRWNDADLDEKGTLTVRRSLDVDGTFKTPKNGKGRTLKLTPRALDSLKAHKARQNEERLQAGGAVDGRKPEPRRSPDADLKHDWELFFVARAALCRLLLRPCIALPNAVAWTA